MSNIIEFEEVDNEQNILRVGGMSLLPADMEWPVNPNGEKLVMILNIPTRKLMVGEETDFANECGGSLFGGAPVFLQNENLEVDAYQFCMQIYGADFPEEFQDIFYLNDSVGYLFLNKQADENDVGLFFTQCS